MLRFDAVVQQALLRHAFAPGRAESRPRTEEFQALLLENVHDSATAVLGEGRRIKVTRLPKALGGLELIGGLQEVHVLGIRSRTQIDEGILAAARHLVAIGCFSVGTSQVDLDTARRRGIPVFNAPFSNTRSVAELVIGEIIMLFRRVFQRSVALHSGEWQKNSSASYEVRGKTLGIVGYGSIGSQLSNLAAALGMRVVFFDVADKLRHGNAERAKSLHDLLRVSDVVSLHVPETAFTHGMIGPGEIAVMKHGSYLINCSRGSVVDLDALAERLRDGHLAGAAVDVFPVEPSSNSEPFRTPLQDLPNVILTPHIGGATEEAQEQIGAEVGRKLGEYINNGSTVGAVNFPQVQLSPQVAGTRFIQVHRNAPGVLNGLNEIFARRHINIASQQLQTDGDIGYVVLDADCGPGDSAGILREMHNQDGTIRARALTRAASPALEA